MSRPLTKRQKRILGALIDAARAFDDAARATRLHSKAWPGWHDKPKEEAWRAESDKLTAAWKAAEHGLHCAAKCAGRELPDDVMERLS